MIKIVKNFNCWLRYLTKGVLELPRTATIKLGYIECSCFSFYWTTTDKLEFKDWSEVNRMFGCHKKSIHARKINFIWVNLIKSWQHVNPCVAHRFHGSLVPKFHLKLPPWTACWNANVVNSEPLLFRFQLCQTWKNCQNPYPTPTQPNIVGFDMKMTLHHHHHHHHHPPTTGNSMSAISQLLLVRFWWNLKGTFLGASRTDSNSQVDICPGIICPGDICPYQ